MRSSWYFLLLISLLLIASSQVSAATSIPMSVAESQLQLQIQGAQELQFRVEVGDLSAVEVNTRNGVFTRLTLPGFHTSQTEGAPELPMMNRLIAVPAGASVLVEVDAVQSRLVDLADYGLMNEIFPAQPSMPKSADPETWPFVYDRAAYSINKVGRELVRVTPQGRLRAMDLGRIEVAPVEYFPATNQLRITESIDFRVIFTGSDQAAGDELMARTYSPFFEPLYAAVANTKAYHDAYPDRVSDVVTMVVITPPEFEAQLADFITWKTERGFHMITGVIGSPEVGTTTATIQTYLHGLYNSPPTGLPAPSFVLFVGDVAQCPTFSESGDATDRPYCAVDGDLVPDMYYGRFSATNSSQLQAILDKTMMYDQYTMPDPSYLAEVTLIAGVDATYATTHGNGQINYGTTHYFNTAHGITGNAYLYPASGSSGAQIIADVDGGVSYINYTAHGSVTDWSNPSFTQSDINSLTNSGQYCLAVGNCCLTSTFDSGECFAETWLRAADKGAIGYIGASNSTYWDEDYWWGVGYHASAEINGTAYPYESTGLGGYDGLFHDHGEADPLWYVTNDALVFCGNLAVQESGSSRTEYYWNIYNLMGDPSLSTYLGVPSVNGVTYPTTVFTTDTSVLVGADHGSYVGLTQGGVLVGAGTVGPSGSLDISLLQTPLTPGVPLHMVVTAQNREPYITDLNVIVPATVTIDPLVIDANVTTP
ncbi:MAG: C25 family cysteine peptidase, partial [bacterium]